MFGEDPLGVVTQEGTVRSDRKVGTSRGRPERLRETSVLSWKDE